MQFRILGPLEVLERDVAQPLGGTKQRALLAILILHRGELVSGERLADELWGERPPPTATKTLQGYISRMRKALGEDVVRTRGHGYVLTLRLGQLDLDEFERFAAEGRHALSAGDAAVAATRLRDALGLWRGPPLADFTYEPFAQAEIARLEEARLAGTEDRIEADLALGRHGQVVPELERLVREHPVRERLRGQLMLSLYRVGRQADALDCYRIGRQALIDDLGIEPGRALQDLEAAILRHDAGLDLPVEAPAPTLLIGTDETGGDGAADAISRDRVLGREEQLRQLRSGLDAAFSRRGAMFMIGGEAGIGKSRLADELAQEARERGAQVVWGRCWEAGGAPGYWPWVQVLRSLLNERDNVDPSTDEEQAVHLNFPYPDAERDLSRGLPLIKWLLAIPHYFVLIFLTLGAIIAAVAAWFTILFTGQYPRSLFDFIEGVLRWHNRVAAYALLLITDRYPPFSLQP